MTQEQINNIALMTDEDLAKFKDLVKFCEILGVSKDKLAKFPDAIDNYERILRDLNANFEAIRKDISSLTEQIIDINQKIRNMNAKEGISIISDLNGHLEDFGNGQ